MSYAEHKSGAEPIVVRTAVVTLSDTRTEATDASGAAIRRLLTEAGHVVVRYDVVRDEPGELEALLRELLAHPEVDAILTNGGTGVSRRDQTVPVIDRLIDTPLPGFGELFRMLSWEQVGSGSMLSRAVGGIAAGKPLFAMPGSTKAVELATGRLIVPELKHLVRELRK